jgi:probable HAF family extracellular repeat protein
VVGTSTTKNNIYHAFVYYAGKMTDLGTIVGTTGSQVLPFSSASGINQIGEIVGTSTYNTPPLDGQLYHPFLYANNHMYDLGTNPSFGSDDGGAVAINDHGQVAGFAQDLGGDIVFGFLYSAGVVTKINNIIPVNPRTPDGVEVNAVNNSGVVVGDDPNEPPATEYGTGFIYRGGVTLNANTLLPPNSGWVIGNCTGINDGGQICGYGLHNGVERSFVLTPVGSPLLP